MAEEQGGELTRSIVADVQQKVLLWKLRCSPVAVAKGARMCCR
jgi:hypothetical protein